MLTDKQIIALVLVSAVLYWINRDTEEKLPVNKRVAQFLMPPKGIKHPDNGKFIGVDVLHPAAMSQPTQVLPENILRDSRYQIDQAPSVKHIKYHRPDTILVPDQPHSTHITRLEPDTHAHGDSIRHISGDRPEPVFESLVPELSY